MCVSNLEINEICELKPWDLPDSVKKSVLRDDDADAAHAAGARNERRSPQHLLGTGP